MAGYQPRPVAAKPLHAAPARGGGMSQNCRKCGSPSSVKDSRPSGQDIRRRRQCHACGHRWTTFEVDESEISSLDLAKRQIAAFLKMLDNVAKSYRETSR
jgi:hypothetical protein